MKKIVNYKVSGEEWTKAKDEAFAKIVKKAKVDGFRQGKVPRSVFEKKYGTGDIISEAMEKIVDVEPIQQNDDEIISETPQQEDVESLTPIEELSDEEFIQEPQSEEKSFNVVENSTVISDMDFAPREIEIDINNPEIQLQPEGPAQLEDLYDENSENSTMLQNPGRLTRGNQQGGKVGLGMGLGIVGVLISIIIVGIIGFSISKMVKKPSDEAPEPITDDAVPTSSDNGVSEANTLNVDQSNVVNMDNTNPIATPVKKQQQAALPKTVAQTPTQSKNSIPATDITANPNFTSTEHKSALFSFSIVNPLTHNDTILL